MQNIFIETKVRRNGQAKSDVTVKIGGVRYGIFGSESV